MGTVKGAQRGLAVEYPACYVPSSWRCGVAPPYVAYGKFHSQTPIGILIGLYEDLAVELFHGRFFLDLPPGFSWRVKCGKMKLYSTRFGRQLRQRCLLPPPCSLQRSFF